MTRLTTDDLFTRLLDQDGSILVEIFGVSSFYRPGLEIRLRRGTDFETYKVASNDVEVGINERGSYLMMKVWLERIYE